LCHIVVAAMRRIATLILSLPFCAPGQQCANCHAPQATQWTASAHAHALNPIDRSKFFSALPDRPIGEARGGYLLEFVPAGNALRVTARRGSDSASALIEWSFGAGQRAETPIASWKGESTELRISYYRSDGKFDLTLGHRAGASETARGAIGIRQDRQAIRRCFGCHSTGGMPGDPGFSPGVGCVACHPAMAGGPHPGNAAMPRVPLAREAVMAVCEQCHRNEPEGNPDDAINVRYQAVRLRRSRCFTEGDLSCVTCHNPHESARTDAAWYRSRCLSCHPTQSSMGNCVECHMQRVAITARLMFTDHWIHTNGIRTRR
jgi:hypothetical protein